MPKCLDNTDPNLYTGDDIEIEEIKGVRQVRCPKCTRTVVADVLLIPGSVIRVKCRRCKQFITLASVQPATP